VPIMMYHQVTANPDKRSDTVSPQLFRSQMKYLKDHGFRVLTLAELVEGIKARRSFPFNSIVITFDDGYENNFTDALPILKEFNFPATVFISPDLFGQAGYLTVEQIAALQRAGFTLGSHGMRQAYLPEVSRAEQEHEIFDSRRIISQQFGVPVKFYCFPLGGYNDEIKKMVKSAGYEASLTSNRGQDRLNRDEFALNRIRFSDNDNRDQIMWIKLLGYYNLFRKLKSPE
jgi:peptidoglycan/xylan/chitin deacetylase (PgdA/CDA1 family)